jgi:hypothetical protein
MDILIPQATSIPSFRLTIQFPYNTEYTDSVNRKSTRNTFLNLAICFIICLMFIIEKICFQNIYGKNRTIRFEWNKQTSQCIIMNPFRTNQKIHSLKLQLKPM